MCILLWILTYCGAFEWLLRARIVVLRTPNTFVLVLSHRMSMLSLRAAIVLCPYLGYSLGRSARDQSYRILRIRKNMETNPLDIKC